MKVYSIHPTTFKAGIGIKSANNKQHQFLYNEVLKLTRDFKIPANFRSKEIELPSISEKIIEKLNELGIKFCQK